MLALTRTSNRLKNVDGEWHEFESKALRRENERKEKEREKELRKAAQKETSSGTRERDRKRPNDSSDIHRESKRPHVEADEKTDRDTQPTNNNRQTQQQQTLVSGQSRPEQPAGSGRAPTGPRADCAEA